MSTAADIIKLALKDIQVLDETEEPSAALQNDALTTLNQMLAQWQTEKLYIYAQTDVTFTPTGASSYTVGTGGNINITRPDRIDYAFLRQANLDFPVIVLTSFEDFQSIGLKTITSTYPEFLYYNPTYPLGTLFIYPQPSASSGIMHIGVSVRLPQFGVAATTINLPLQYDMAIRWSLAELLAIMMGRPQRLDISIVAAKARRLLKRANLKISDLKFDDSTEWQVTRILRGY